MLDQTPILCAQMHVCVCVNCSVKQNKKVTSSSASSFKTSNEFSRFVSFRFSMAQCVPTAVSHSTMNVKSLKIPNKRVAGMPKGKGNEKSNSFNCF